MLWKPGSVPTATKFSLCVLTSFDRRASAGLQVLATDKREGGGLIDKGDDFAHSYAVSLA